MRMGEGFKKKIRKPCLELQRGQVRLIEKKQKHYKNRNV